jgi:hypothetical protein
VKSDPRFRVTTMSDSVCNHETALCTETSTAAFHRHPRALWLNYNPHDPLPAQKNHPPHVSHSLFVVKNVPRTWPWPKPLTMLPTHNSLHACHGLHRCEHLPCHTAAQLKRRNAIWWNGAQLASTCTCPAEAVVTVHHHSWTTVAAGQMDSDGTLLR